MITAHFRDSTLIKLLYFCGFNDRAMMTTRKLIELFCQIDY